VVRRERNAVDVFCERMRFLPRFLAASNERVGRPLSSHDLTDLAQDVTTLVLQKLETFEGRATLETWVGRIGYLEMMNLVRRLRGRARRSLTGLEEAAETVEDRSGEASDEAGHYEKVLRCLEKIDAELAVFARLKHLDGLTFEEIGISCGMSPNTVKTRYYRGMKRVRRELEEALRKDDSR